MRYVEVGPNSKQTIYVSYTSYTQKHKGNFMQYYQCICVYTLTHHRSDVEFSTCGVMQALNFRYYSISHFRLGMLILYYEIWMLHIIKEE